MLLSTCSLIVEYQNMFKNIFYFLQGDEWLSYCDEESKPKIEQLFDTLKDEIFFTLIMQLVSDLVCVRHE